MIGHVNRRPSHRPARRRLSLGRNLSGSGWGDVLTPSSAVRGVGTLCHAPLVRIEAAMVAHGIAASRFGRDAANDAGLVSRLRCRPSVTPEMRDRLNAFIDALDSGEVVNG